MKKWLAAAAVLFVGLIATMSRAADPPAEKLFDELAHDFGNVAQGTELVHKFKLTNTYKVPLNISDARVSMNHSVLAKATQECLQPGESAYIEVSMNTKYFVGPKTVPVYVRIVGNDKFWEVVLKVSANSQEK
jgi:hypothetical protein